MGAQDDLTLLGVARHCHCLLPTRGVQCHIEQVGIVVDTDVLDGLRAHKAASIREALAARGCKVLFLPPYSPDCTPIEQAFSKLKAIVRGLGARLCAARHFGGACHIRC